ncbi:hypothetical protein N7533_010420 [Penicillium manginii]|uniref:uncharacterized protein n=1 Tax=Penicillium manginii TaxID=203109 RepID=UPI002546E890|nr:uncharacterized protein N7533_010420 [Penicillium manginii]KAJ5743318.1 hypothetical protein N7533_010420 [Penicillium manginii]
MSQHSSLGWSDWEEDNLLPWLKKTRALSWDARAAAYRIMKNMGSSELWNRYEGKNTTFSANAVLIVRMHLHITHIQSAKDVFDDLEVPERDSQHSRIPRLKISTSDFRKYLQQNPPLRRTVPPQKSHIPFVRNRLRIILSHKNPSPGPGFGIMYTVSVQPIVKSLTERGHLETNK